MKLLHYCLKNFINLLVLTKQKKNLKFTIILLKNTRFAWRSQEKGTIILERMVESLDLYPQQIKYIAYPHQRCCSATHITDERVGWAGIQKFFKGMLNQLLAKIRSCLPCCLYFCAKTSTKNKAVGMLRFFCFKIIRLVNF